MHNFVCCLVRLLFGRVDLLAIGLRGADYSRYEHDRHQDRASDGDLLAWVSPISRCIEGTISNQVYPSLEY